MVFVPFTTACMSTLGSPLPIVTLVTLFEHVVCPALIVQASSGDESANPTRNVKVTESEPPGVVLTRQWSLFIVPGGSLSTTSASIVDEDTPITGM